MILYSMPMNPEQLRLIQDYGRQHRTPTLAVHSAGFYSYFTVQLPGAFPIVETHPDDTATADLRLLSPWPELAEYAKSMSEDIEKLDNHEHGHLPLVVILLHYLEAWKQNHNGEVPTKYADKTAFRTLVSDAMRKDTPEGGEENFEEAVAAVMKHIVTPSLPSSLKQVFDYQHQGSVCFTSTEFNAYFTCLPC
jgi:amyloid beta precursor protein binding protein 1